EGAQQKPPGVGEVAPGTSAAKPGPAPKPAPLDKHQTAMLAEIAATPHAFDGRLTWGPQPRPDVQLDPLDCAFVGGIAAHDDGELRWHSMLDWTVLQRGDRGATRHGRDGPAAGRTRTGEQIAWQSPQGDAPEVPLSPRLLLEQLPKANI